MVKNRYSRMSELDRTASQRYLDNCQARLDGVAQEDSLENLLDENELESIDTADREHNEKTFGGTDEALEVTEAWVRIRLVVWRYMWNQRAAVRDAGIEPLPQEPFGGRKILHLATEMATKAAQKIPPLPDELAVVIMNAAHAYMETAAPDVLRMVKDMLALRDIYSRTATISKHMRKWEFSVSPGQGACCTVSGLSQVPGCPVTGNRAGRSKLCGVSVRICPPAMRAWRNGFWTRLRD